ncbi:hypothetical protein WL96_12710 [Burkholderia vietnamiensis]|nr:hypothetical protein WL96_12710 [Burkholderia vietnamiensis]
MKGSLVRQVIKRTEKLKNEIRIVSTGFDIKKELFWIKALVILENILPQSGGSKTLNNELLGKPRIMLVITQYIIEEYRFKFRPLSIFLTIRQRPIRLDSIEPTTNTESGTPFPISY